MHKSPVQNGKLIIPPSPKISGHVSAGRFQPVCLRPGSALSQNRRGTALFLSSVRYLLNLNFGGADFFKNFSPVRYDCIPSMDVTYSIGAEVLALAPGPSRATSEEYQTHVLPMGSANGDCINYDVTVGPAGWNPYGLGQDPLCWGRSHRHCKLHI